MAATATKVKGLAFQTVIKSLARLRGADSVPRLFERLPAPLKAQLEFGAFVPGGWYGVDDYRELLAAVRDTTGEGREFMKALGAECSRQDLSGVYRVFTRLLSPQTLFSGAMRLYKSYYDQGQVWVVESRPGAAHGIWRGCLGFDQNMWDEVQGSVVAILELGGAHDVRLRIVSGGGEKDDHLELWAYWSLG